MLKIISIGFQFKSADVLNINFEDKQTLLDSDIVIIDPESFNRYWNKAFVMNDGIKYLASSQGSNQIRTTFELRKKEITTLLNKGKVLITFLSPIQKIQVDIGNGGFGNYGVITNYDFLPDDESDILNDLVNGNGDGIKLHNPKHLFANYYKAYQNELQYFAYFDIKKIDADNFFLLNKSDKLIGFSKNSKNGLLVFLPYTRNFNEEKLLGVLINCAKPYLSKEIRTPIPEWISDFKISGEAELVGKIELLNVKIQEIERQKSVVEKELDELNEIKGLLYEQGKLLEESAIKAFRILGFGAEKRQKDDMEHDIILTSPEGRAIVEVEGKDNDSLHIDKLDQLSRVVDEDFKLSGSYPEGILLGNHFRYTHPLKRKEAFTDKVKIASDRKKFVLLTTFELYKAVCKILENPPKEDTTRELRNKIFTGKGKEIKLIEDK
ncbi:MAG: hypothetical protein O8C63_04695 [Candidatus Methanoperedens sp.]|nr:hypothetical protein [Candidatus Methanoperedens sp.]